MGFIETNSGAYDLFGKAAKVLAGYLDDELNKPTKVEGFNKLIQNENPDLTGGMKFVKSARHEGYVDAGAMKKKLEKLLK